jgi:hypothetical protein
MRVPLLAILLLASCLHCFAAIELTTTTLPNGTVRSSYSAVVVAQNGCTPYVWSVTGALPVGVTFTPINNTQSLSLAGTPTTASSYAFSVQVKGCGGHTSKVNYTVVIQPAPVEVVNLSWTASTSGEIAGYNMYRGPDGVNWEMINTGGLIASTLYSDSTVANDSTYYYAVTAVNTSGVQSAKSAAIKAAIP